MIESEKLQNEIAASLDKYLPRIAYQLKLNDKGEIIWLDQQKGGKILKFTHDPETTRFQRFMMHLVTTFPAEWAM